MVAKDGPAKIEKSGTPIQVRDGSVEKGSAKIQDDKIQCFFVLGGPGSGKGTLCEALA